MPDSDYRTGHLIALDVDEMEEITGMVEPARCSRIVRFTIVKGIRQLR